MKKYIKKFFKGIKEFGGTPTENTDAVLNLVLYLGCIIMFIAALLFKQKPPC